LGYPKKGSTPLPISLLNANHPGLKNRTTTEDPQLATLTNIEIAKAGGATDKMVAYIREKELIATELS
jgi:hypothetical protein